MLPPIVIFDLDGTLADTAPDLLNSLNHVLESEGLEAVTLDRLRRYVGQGGRVMLERAFAAANRPIDDQIADRLVASFVAHYEANMPGQTLPFPGVMKSIAKLQETGFICAICTNKTQTLARKLLSALAIDHHFAAICGGDTFAFKKPDGRHILQTIAQAGGNPDRAVMIGDSAADINAAHDACIPVIAVPFGYTDVPVSTFEPTHIIDHFDQLTPDLVHRLIRRTTD